MAYSKKMWIDLPNTTTPINATGMNDLETRVKALDTSIMDMIGLATTTTKSIPNNLRINGADLNEIEGTGLFIAFGPCTNVPMYEGVATNHWYLIQIEYSSDYRYQIIQRLAGNGTDTFTRIKVGGTWQEWIPKNSQNYSTNEIKIGSWIDGKPLYRKVIYISALPNNNVASYSAGISNFKRLINMNGWFQGNGGVTTGDEVVTRPINFMLSAAEKYNIYGFYNVTTGNIRITTLSDLSYLSGYVIMEYTKTTD